METCVRKDCPFIPYCKHYSLAEDKGAECKTQQRMLAAAEVLRKQKESVVENYAERNARLGL